MVLTIWGDRVDLWGVAMAAISLGEGGETGEVPTRGGRQCAIGTQTSSQPSPSMKVFTLLWEVLAALRVVRCPREGELKTILPPSGPRGLSPPRRWTGHGER